MIICSQVPGRRCDHNQGGKEEEAEDGDRKKKKKRSGDGEQRKG